MKPSSIAHLLALVVTISLLAAACGDDGGDSGESDAGESDSAQSDAGESDAGESDSGESDAGESDSGESDAGESDSGQSEMPAECPASVPFTVQAAITVDGAVDAFEVVDAVALRRSEGRAYTVYLADFEIDPDTSWSFAVPEVPAGSTLISTGMDVFNGDPAELEPLEVGSSGPLFSEAGDGATATFLSMLGEGAPTSSVGQVGTSEILFLDDLNVCIEVDITAESGAQLQGIYTALIIEEI